MSSPPYVPLWVKSNHSFLTGSSHPEELVDAAASLGLAGLALTDRAGVYGAVKAQVRARSVGLPLVVGAECDLDLGRVLLLACDRAGYGNLCRLLTLAHAGQAKGVARLGWPALAAHPGGLLALSADAALLAPLSEIFADRLYALFPRHLAPGEAAGEAARLAACRRLGVAQVAATEVLYHHRGRAPLQAIMACIRQRTTLAAAGRRLPANFEHGLLSCRAMAARFADQPQWLARTVEVAARCQFRLEPAAVRSPLPADAPGVGAQLRALAAAGLRWRYGPRPPPAVRAQLDEELALIAELGYGGYFLTMHEVVRFAGERDIYCQGRGSAANSLVCFCLGITAVDPMAMRLLFARFLSRERAEPPDIDLDIEHHRREEVMQWVYRRWGRRHAALVANLVRYRVASAVRDVGAAWGLAAAPLARLGARLAAGEPGEAVVPAAWRPLAEQLLSTPRHLSVHPGGFLITAAPLDSLVPVENATMAGRTVVQWDKADVEDMQLFKMDLLGLGALHHIHRAVDLIRTLPGAPGSLAEVPAEDPATYAMLSRGDTVGVFQLESRAQMAMLPRLRPRTFYDLVVEVAIVRPGPIQGDMVHPYLRAREAGTPASLPHPALAEVLSRTWGVPIFQEQVMQIAMLCARYTPGEADQLRRDMAAWRSTDRMLAHHDRLVERMVEAGIDRPFAERIFGQIRGFGEYGFPESHAASFAHLAYVTAWLKCHHPAAFACALINAQPMGFYGPATVVEDARRHGVEVQPVDVNVSGWDCHLEGLERAPVLRMGLRMVSGLGEAAGRRLAAAAPYRGLDEVCRQGGICRAELALLARAGALASMSSGRRQALWEGRALAGEARQPLPLPPSPSAVSLPPLGRAEAVAWDYATTGHSPRGHPMAAARPALARMGVVAADHLARSTAPRACHVAGIVICRQRPQTASGVVFLSLEDETGVANIVLWKPVFERYQALARSAGVLGVSGRRQLAHGVVHVIAERLWLPPVEARGPSRPPPAARRFWGA